MINATDGRTNDILASATSSNSTLKSNLLPTERRDQPEK
jgi:hypothetical protein